MTARFAGGLLLALDIGNTQIVAGVFRGARLRGQWRLSTDLRKTADQYAIELGQCLALHRSVFSLRSVNGMIVSSVVPPLTPVFEEMGRRFLGRSPMFVTHELKTGIKIAYHHPGDVGADRIVNAAAAFHRYGGPVVILDFGTATTVCAVTASGEYLGGAIAPGIMISSEALFQRASKLPRVELRRPDSVIGRDTTESIQSGVIYGFAGMADGLVARFKKELGHKTRVIATGGMAGLVAEASHEIDEVVPSLTLDGLQLIYEMNRGRKSRAKGEQ